jgi:putative cell wall-binding protein
VGTAALVAKSTDGGRTFFPAVVAIPGKNEPTQAGNTTPVDQAFPKLAVKPGGGVGGADKIVLATNAGVFDQFNHIFVGTVDVTVSNDGGATWGPPVVASKRFDPAVNPFGAQEHSQPVLGPNGEIYVAWRTSSDKPEGFIRVGKSTDDGKTWTEVDATNVKGFVYDGPLPAPPENGPFSANGRIFTASSFPRLAGDPTTGNVYLVWNQDAHLYGSSPAAMQAQDHFMIQRSQVWFMRSTDGSATWGGRKQLSEEPPRLQRETLTENLPSDPGNHETQTRHPQISVAPNGRVDVLWNDRRHAYGECSQTHVACLETRLGDTYYSYSSDAGAGFSPNRRITDRTIGLDVGFDYRFSTYWQFGPVSVPLGNGSIMSAWMDSREGDFDNDIQDIYMATTDLNADASTTPAVSIRQTSPTGLSVALSRKAYPGGPEAVVAGTFASKPATRVVIANQSDYPSVLAAGVLARANLSTLLLAPPGGLTPDVKAEVTRMKPLGAYVVGDTSLLSSQVEADLAAAGVPSGQIVRVGGANPAALAANVANAMDRRRPTDKTAGLNAFDAVIIADPASPDAAAAAELASARRLPYLFVNGNSIPPETSAALAALNINLAYVVGGPNVVGDGAVSQLASTGRNPQRFGGPNQYATSGAIVQESVREGEPANQVFLADGDNPLHGALLGSASARIGGLLLLTPRGNVAAVQSIISALHLPPFDRAIVSQLTRPIP